MDRRRTHRPLCRVVGAGAASPSGASRHSAALARFGLTSFANCFSAGATDGTAAGEQFKSPNCPCDARRNDATRAVPAERVQDYWPHDQPRRRAVVVEAHVPATVAISAAARPRRRTYGVGVGVANFAVCHAFPPTAGCSAHRSSHQFVRRPARRPYIVAPGGPRCNIGLLGVHRQRGAVAGPPSSGVARARGSAGAASEQPAAERVATNRFRHAIGSGGCAVPAQQLRRGRLLKLRAM
mmetsp:Transcript_81248/g.226188  ORF Transcript_81248/g.226188 Transcript_81248/m.226188 type:complete len:239 (-) Transcript_81248:60-776(-)